MREFSYIGVDSLRQWFFMCIRAGKGAEDVADVRRLLCMGVDVNCVDHNGISGLVHALKAGPEMMQALLEAGADPNITNENGYTPLRAAIALKKGWAMKLLLDRNADPDRLDKKDLTAWQHAAAVYPEGLPILEEARRRRMEEKTLQDRRVADEAQRRTAARARALLKAYARRISL